MSFDEIIDRRGSHCVKWDMMETLFGVSPDEGIAMWVADMDFPAPDCVQAALREMTEHGVYGYFGDDRAYKDAVRWWQAERRGWPVEDHWIFTTNGLVNGTALCVDAFTRPGEGVVMFTPIYHAFFRVIRAAGREVIELEMALEDGRYELDFDAYEDQLPDNARMLVLCSPHNPGGRVFTRAELERIAEFARKHDLIIVSDEIHCDLLMPGQTHIPMALIDGISDRLVMMTAGTKTFNLAGAHVGNVIIEDADLREAFARRMAALGISPNAFGMRMMTAAYSPEGAAWVDALMAYVAENAKLFDTGINAIPGLRSMPLESTYLAWVDFSGTGMTREEFTDRVKRHARIAVNHGPTFGKGGDSHLRFNIAAPRATIRDAVERMQAAFADLQ
jgi:cystathionine beta-lyase